MSFPVRVLALWLAAFWLPLTLHCELADLKICCDLSICCEDEPGCDDHSCCGETGNHETDACKIIESGNYRLNDHSVPVPAAAVSLIEPLEVIDCRSMPAQEVTLNEATGAPPGSSRVWQFVFRAARTPRAPSARC